MASFLLMATSDHYHQDLTYDVANIWKYIKTEDSLTINWSWPILLLNKPNLTDWERGINVGETRSCTIGQPTRSTNITYGYSNENSAFHI